MRIRFLALLALGAGLLGAISLPAQARVPSGDSALTSKSTRGVAKPAVAGVSDKAARKRKAHQPGAANLAARRDVAKRTDASAFGAKRTTVAARRDATRGARLVKVVAPRSVEPRRVSMGQAIGLHSVDDPLDLRSSVALVVDQGTGEVLFSKNANAVLPIASITKLMTAMVVLDAQQSMSEILEISDADIDTEKGTRSRLRPGTRLTRGELLQLALMSSENRAANALGRHFPSGLPAFVASMNAKARLLGMADTSYIEPTGLSSSNVSSARDLSRLVRAALDYPLIRQFSTASELTVDTGYRMVSFRNTNRLLSSPSWDIGLQKTGYISEAGSCLVMQVSIENRPMVMVLLDAIGVRSRFGDAERLRHWLENRAVRPGPLRTVATHDSLGS